MKKILNLLLAMPAILLGQEGFSFPVFFEDAVGKKDTVYFGFDSLATDGLDASYGEVNISNAPWDTSLEVRLAGVRTWQGQGLNYSYPYQTRKLIASPRCDAQSAVFTVKILTRHWPVTARWDSTRFQGACLGSSVFSSIISDAIADSRRVTNGVPGTFLGFVRFSNESQVTFTAQKYGRFEYLYEVNPVPSRLDTVNLFWISLNQAAFEGHVIRVSGSQENFADSRRLIVGDRLDVSGLGSHVTSIRIMSLAGRVVAVPVFEKRFIDLSRLKSGVYVLNFVNHGKHVSYVIFKQ